MDKKFYGVISLGICVLILLITMGRWSTDVDTLTAKFFNWMEIHFIPIALLVILILAVFWIIEGIVKDILKMKKALRNFIDNYEEKPLK